MEGSDGAVIAESLEAPGVFGVIFDRHGSTLLRFLARRVDPAEAEDLLGEVFRIAFERRAAFERDRDSARPWLYGIAANLVAKHYRSEARRLRAMARAGAECDQRQVLSKIDVPTLLVYGGNDVRAPLSVAEELHAAIPSSTLTVLPGAGHACSIEAARRFNAEIRAFLHDLRR